MVDYFPLIVFGGYMETVIEYALIFLWDVVKTVILQWLVHAIKDWWDSRKNLSSLQYA